MIQFKALLIKELKEAFRDKRALVMAMMMAFMAPIMIAVISKVMISEWVEKPPVYVNISGAEFAPKLIQRFTDDNIKLLSEAEGSDLEIWTKWNIELLIPDNFPAEMEAGRPIDLVLRADFSEKALSSPLRRINDTIATYSRTIAASRLLMRGIDSRLLTPVVVQEQDTASPGSNAVFISMLLGMYLLMGAFLSGLSVAIDSSAGERERNVLEILLCQPLKTSQIVWAKLCTASLIAVIGVILTLTLTYIAVGFVDLTKIGATFTLSFYEITALLLLLLPICLFAGALQLFIAFKAKSFKEAQSSVTMIIMLPAFIPFAISFIDNRPDWLNWLPVSGQSLIMEDLFKGLPISWAGIGVTGIVTIAMALGLVHWLSNSLKSEKVVLALS